jgi:hypothetical protein
MIDLEYFVKHLRAQCREITLFIHANEDIHHRFCPQGHGLSFEMDKGSHVDRTVDGSFRTFLENCEFENMLATTHGPDGNAHQIVKTDQLCAHNSGPHT